MTISQINPVWASSSEALTEQPADDYVFRGYRASAKPTFENLNYIWNQIHNRLNEVISVYAELDTAIIATAELKFLDNIELKFGDSANPARIKYSEQDNGQLRFGVPTSNTNLFIFANTNILTSGPATTIKPTLILYPTTGTSYCWIRMETADMYFGSLPQLYINPRGNSVVIGTGLVSSGLAADSLYCSADLEVDGTLFVEDDLSVENAQFETQSGFATGDAKEVLGTGHSIDTWDSGDKTSFLLLDVSPAIYDITVNLPAPDRNGRRITLKKKASDSNSIIVKSGTTTIDTMSHPTLGRVAGEYMYVSGLGTWVKTGSYVPL